MGVDLFVGPLERYLTGDWETPLQTFAREHNVAYNRIGPDPNWLDRQSAERATVEYREKLGTQLGDILVCLGGECSSWDYHAFQLTPQGLAALVLCAGHMARRDAPLPKRLPADVWAEPIVRDAVSDGYYFDSMAIFEAQVAVCGVESKLCKSEDPMGRSVFVVTTEALHYAVDQTKKFLALSEDDIVAAIGKGPPATPQVFRNKNGHWERETPVLAFDEVRAYATWALACLSEALRLSAKGHVIIRDE